tara:strand:+ start:4041 stop:4373 length:333 start_codon:yes stop_codon:yes gene_type:complete
MTKAKAMEQMLEYDRALIDPALARKIAKAFGYKLSDLGIKPRKCKDFYRCTFAEAELTAVGTCYLAQSIAQKFDKDFRAPQPFNGTGSNAEHMTQKSVEFIKTWFTGKNK